MVVWLRRLAWLIVAVGVLWIAAWPAVPALIKWLAPQQLSKALGRTVTFGAVGFKPWTLELTVDDIAVAGTTPAAAPLLTVKRIHADLSLSSVVRGAPVIEALEFDAPQVNVARLSPGHYDIDDLIARFSAPPDEPAGEPAHFALYNLQMRDAQLNFDDRPVSRVQKIEALRLALPFISNLPAEVEVKVEPHLAFRLNGTVFDSGAQATPFAQNKAGTLRLTMADLDLAPYLGYLPAALPVRVSRGSVSGDLNVQFAVPKGGSPSVIVRGEAGAKDLELTDTAGAPVLSWQRLQLALRDVEPLARQLAFESLRIDGLQLHATRDAAGRVNLAQLGAPAAAASAPARSASPVVPAKSPPPWRVSLETLDLAGARVLWNDATTRPAAALQLDGMALSARQLRWPLEQPIPATLSGTLHQQGSATGPSLAEFSVTGPVTDHDAQLALTLKGLSLAALSPYIAQALGPTVDGQVTGRGQLDWSSAAAAPRLKLALDTLTLDALTLREGRGADAHEPLSFKQLALAKVQLDLLARSAVLGSVKLVQPNVAIARDAEGRFDAARWVVPAKPAAAPAPGNAAAPWRVRFKDVLVDSGQLLFTDAQPRADGRPNSRPNPRPVRLALADLRLAVQGLAWPLDAHDAPSEVQLNTRIGGAALARGDASRSGGLVDYKGRIAAQPLQADGQLRIERLPLQLFEPYVGDRLQLRLLRAEAGYKGDLAVHELPEGWDVAAAGDLLLGDVHVAALPDAATPANDELLSWQSFAFKGLKLALKPGARPQLDIADAELSDLYSRLVVTEEGRLNLQRASGTAVAAAVPASGASTPAAINPGPPLPLDVRVANTRLVNGRIDFSDRFVRPNYSAALTELNGQLGAFDSASREMATLSLRGRAAGTALLDISGRLNPTAQPLALDIKAKATDLELAPLSPYAGKYAGYAIERGKLSVELAYKIAPDGRLEASNQVVLNQLTFGQKVESKDATKLPVLLAVALLKDRNGVIDLNLPVSGSLNDPQFSITGLVGKLLVNVLTKALTSPFSLLGGAGGGGGAGEDLSRVAFQPGTAVILPDGAAALDKVAKALIERPGLKLTVTGAADENVEREAFQRAAIETRLLDERRRQALRAGTPAASASAPAALSADERTQLLTQLYKDTRLPNKPRNLMGFAKSLPPAEMEALLQAQVPVDGDAMRALALQRALAVRDALIAKGLAGERLFLAAPQLQPAGANGGAWSPSVQLALTVN